MEILKCDICGRTSSEVFMMHRHKLKRETYTFDGFMWERLDICDDCLQEIRNRVRKGGKKEAGDKCERFKNDF